MIDFNFMTILIVSFLVFFFYVSKMIRSYFDCLLLSSFLFTFDFIVEDKYFVKLDRIHR